MATPNLALFPSGRKATKLYSVLPTDGTGDFTVSRASQGSEINSDLKIQNVANNVPRFTYDTLGGCPSLLTEPQSTNLITYPVSFGNSYWTKSGASIQGDASTAGAEKVTNGDFATDTDWTKGTSWTIAAGVAHFDYTTSSVLTSDIAPLTIGNYYKMTFTISNCSTLARIYFASEQIWRSLANGTYTYYYYSATTIFSIIAADDPSHSAFDIDNISVKEVQGFSSPHVDYPTSAFKLVEDTSTGVHGISKGVSAVGSDYSLSILAKADSRRYVSLAFSDAVVWLAQYTFDLVGGTLTDSYDFAGVTSTFKSEALADGWYRLSLSSNYAFAATVYARIFIEETATPPTIPSNTYTGDGTSGVYLFGAQLEQQSVATSFMYNGTEGVTVTRNADVVVGAGDVNTFNDSEGVLMIETATLSELDITARYFQLSDGTVTANGITFRYYTTTNYFQALYYDSGAYQAVCSVFLTDSSEFNKIAFKYKENDFALWVNGIEVASDASGSTGHTLSNLQFNNNGFDKFYGKTKQIQYFPTALTDTELATLTTL